MSNDSYVRRKVREVMEAGKLPHRQPDHIWGGPGSGLSCAICDVALERDGVELEIQYLPDAGSAGSYRVHVGCFSQFEPGRPCRRRMPAPGLTGMGVRVAPERPAGLPDGLGCRHNPRRGSGAAY
jgi:hypothetical protein